MDHDRLRVWLGLPTDPWPPDHYALLGLTRGTGDLTDIEGRVLDRMELLRPHQLLHPELVTEGMNRLAQALVCLTDPVARAAYDRELGIPAPPFEVVEDDPRPTPTVEVTFRPGLQPPAELAQSPPETEKEPDSLPYEVVPTEPKSPSRPLPYEVVTPESNEPDFVPVPPISLLPVPVSQRAVYRQLAALRKALRVWENLRPVFGTPTESLATPVAVLLFVQALAEARRVLPTVDWVIREPGTAGGTVAALVRAAHALHAVRVLVASQRQAVALDWRRGFEELCRERDRLRAAAYVARPRRRGSSVYRAARELSRTPEWCLLGVALAALVLAVWRRKP